MFHHTNGIFNQFKINIAKLTSEEDQINKVNVVTERYIEIYTLFDTSFSLLRRVCGKITGELIGKLRIIIQKVMLC